MILSKHQISNRLTSELKIVISYGHQEIFLHVELQGLKQVFISLVKKPCIITDRFELDFFTLIFH